jgi:hypothetical protein
MYGVGPLFSAMSPLRRGEFPLVCGDPPQAQRSALQSLRDFLHHFLPGCTKGPSARSEGHADPYVPSPDTRLFFRPAVKKLERSGRLTIGNITAGAARE